jgi:type IV fimbrial biogenesis protein FimT
MDNKMNSLVSFRTRGFTLIELLITLALVVVLLTLVVPSMKNFFDRERLISATEQVYSHLQQARIESIARSTSVYAQISTDADDGSWSYGVSIDAACDPTKTLLAETNCFIEVDDGDGVQEIVAGTNDDDLVYMRFDSTEYQGVMASVDTGNIRFVFDPLRGTIETLSANTISLKSEGLRTLDIRIGALGQISICSPDDNVSGYRACNYPPEEG